jgi:hypothetical protein
MSRRKVELEVPPPTLSPSPTAIHVQRQVVRLLRMADLPIPADAPQAQMLPFLDKDFVDEEEDEGGAMFSSSEFGGDVGGSSRHNNSGQRRVMKQTQREVSRDQF